ncbi:MAG: NAD(P)-dependent oxidoreductase [Rhodoferax sp.]|nr:NAD(P)-dependent oxidoreductase [Rhodoferax sp.]
MFDHLDSTAYAGKRLFITGGTGFFGLWLLSALARMNARGLKVEVCVLSRDSSKFLTRYTQFRAARWLRFVIGNVRNFSTDIEPFDWMIHAATETSTNAHAQPWRMFDDIALGTRQVIECAVRAKASRMLLVSSGAVYGPQYSTLHQMPDDSLQACSTLSAANAYGEGKRVMELMGCMAQESNGIESLVARCYAFAGPGLPLDGHFAIGNFVRDALYSDAIRVKGDGTALRSYLYGADLAVWLLQLLAHGRPGTAYNVGSDIPISIGQLAHAVRDVLAPSMPVHIENRILSKPDDQSVYVPSISRARNELKLQPWTSLETALRRTGAYYLGHSIP